MKVTCFDDLSLSTKALVLKEFGAYIHSMETHDYKILLYSLNQHFIEAYYSFHSNKIEVISVADYDDLDKYLPQICLWKM